MDAQYLNTDLELESDSDLTGLVAALENLGLTSLYCGPNDNGNWHATLEADLGSDEPIPSIVKLLLAIDSLDEAHRQMLSNCLRKEFDVGYECTAEPFESGDVIDNEILRRIVDLGATIRFTIYRSDKPEI
ncbi:MAG TPA: hypothetical protein VGL56_07530 [Fimbriimonadaceae bacterium]|jgi:hypothetical protein